MLVNAGGGFSQDVDVVAGLLHVEEEEDRDGAEGKHHQPDEGQDIRHDDKLGGGGGGGRTQFVGSLQRGTGKRF